MTLLPKVSIVIPAKNEAGNIGACLDSIVAIDYPAEEYEIIVVDNGSHDQTTQIAASKGAIVYKLPNVNISTLRNFGTSHAKAEIVVFLDADCTVKQDWLIKAEKYFQDKNIVCFGSAPNIPDQATWVQVAWFQVRKNKERVANVNWLESMNMFVHKEVYEKIGGFDETLITCEDVDLSYRISEHGRIVSDQGIKAIHHGEAKDIVEYFRKECWRGKSNYSGLRQHGLHLVEIPSLILPLYQLVMTTVFFLAILGGQWPFVAYVSFLWQLPIAGITLLKLHRHSSYKYYGQLFILYNVYYYARGLAVFKK